MNGEVRSAVGSVRGVAPREVLAAALLLGGVGLVFALITVGRAFGSGADVGLVAPTVCALLGGVIAYGLLRRVALARIAAFGLVALAAMLHGVIALSAAPGWVRLLSLLALAGYAVAGALLGSRAVSAFLAGGAR